jgi:hypothetical protein
MSYNPYAQLKAILPDPPLLVGTVLAFDDGTAIIELPDGSQVQARGDTTVGSRVFFRDNLIEGPAPTLTYEEIEI